MARTLGFVLGLSLAGPLAFAAGEAAHGFVAWTMIVAMPALGTLAGERLARRAEETFVPVLAAGPEPCPHNGPDVVLGTRWSVLSWTQCVDPRTRTLIE